MAMRIAAKSSLAEPDQHSHVADSHDVKVLSTTQEDYGRGVSGRSHGVYRPRWVWTYFIPSMIHAALPRWQHDGARQTASIDRLHLEIYRRWLTQSCVFSPFDAAFSSHAQSLFSFSSAYVFSPMPQIAGERFKSFHILVYYGVSHLMKEHLQLSATINSSKRLTCGVQKVDLSRCCLLLHSRSFRK